MPNLEGIGRLAFSNSILFRISDNPFGYISPTSDGEETLNDFLAKTGWSLREQAGSGYIFVHRENGRTAIATGVLDIRRYRICIFQTDKD